MRLVASLVLGCALSGCGSNDDTSSAELDPARRAFADGRFADALDACDAAANPCEARYCELVARTLLWVDDFNHVLLPTFRSADTSLIESGGTSYDLAELTRISSDMSTLSGLVPGIVGDQCAYEIPSLPFRLLGDEGDWVVDAEIRGRWTPASAAFVGAAVDSIRYIFAASIGSAKVPEPPAGDIVPGLPDLLESVSARLAEQESWVRAHPALATEQRGGWHDANGNGSVDVGDELLVDLFVPGTNERVFDFSKAAPVDRESLPRGVLTPTAELPAARCGYQKWHIETLFDEDVGTTDGLSFSSDGKRIAFPKRVDGDYQLFLADVDGKNPTCITCDVKNAWNDGVRFRPEHADTLLFVSTRDHPTPWGCGGGFGQELYAMRADGTSATRLTTSGAWATNYHANWSHDGKQIVWGTTQNRTWDVMVADFVDDASGMRLENVRRLIHDTSWWETHDFTLDGRSVITTNTRAGWQSADLYAIDVESRNLTRLTDDLAWDEHAHLSPDGRKLSWISGRWRPASVWRLTDGSHSALYDFFWIGPAIFFNFLNPPAGFSTELTLMNADGTELTRLTSDDEVCADNVWSPDSTKILFRQTPVGKQKPAKLRMLHFDDCTP